jgi:hypothetical protein
MRNFGGSRVGFTGHQTLSPGTRESVAVALMEELKGERNLVGLVSLAAGADQIFAKVVLELGGRVIAVVPSEHYERSFASDDDLINYRFFLKQAYQTITMPFDEPSEHAYWSTGQEIVNRSDRLLAVWDGKPAAGLGGTADVVRYARSHGTPVTVIWPEGARRE